MTDAIDGLLSSLLSSLWRASWQGALALVLALLLCRVLARRLPADAHCWLWRLSYVKLLVGLLWGGAVLLPVLALAPPPAVVAPLRSVAPSIQAAGPSTVSVDAAPRWRLRRKSPPGSAGSHTSPPPTSPAARSALAASCWR